MFKSFFKFKIYQKMLLQKPSVSLVARPERGHGRRGRPDRVSLFLIFGLVILGLFIIIVVLNINTFAGHFVGGKLKCNFIIDQIEEIKISEESLKYLICVKNGGSCFLKISSFDRFFEKFREPQHSIRDLLYPFQNIWKKTLAQQISRGLTFVYFLQKI
jgi:hypothetical protein